jgi:hypothetical protein
MKSNHKTSGSLWIPLLLCLLGMNVSFAGRRVIPGPDNDPAPGQSKKVTRVDYEDKGKREKDREDRAKQCEIHDDDDPDEREAKRRELEVILAEDKADQKQWARQQAEAPEDFRTEAPKVQASPDPKVKSANETKVVAAPVIAKAAQEVVRRSR